MENFKDKQRKLLFDYLRFITVRSSSCGKVMFSLACVKNSVHGGGVHGKKGVHGRGCMAGGLHGRGCVWQGSVCGRGACMAGGHAWQRVCVAGDVYGGGQHA